MVSVSSGESTNTSSFLAKIILVLGLRLAEAIDASEIVVPILTSHYQVGCQLKNSGDFTNLLNYDG